MNDSPTPNALTYNPLDRKGASNVSSYLKGNLIYTNSGSSNSDGYLTAPLPGSTESMRLSYTLPAQLAPLINYLVVLPGVM